MSLVSFEFRLHCDDQLRSALESDQLVCAWSQAGAPDYMRPQSLQQSVRIRAKPDLVWGTLVEAGKIATWMGGAQVASTWQPGSAVSLTGELHGHPYRDRGTVLACEPERLLRYSHWSALSRRDDSEKTRSVITLTLIPDGDETILEVRHENLKGKAATGHARFFWSNALSDIKKMTESGSE